MNHDSYNQPASYGQPSNHSAPGAWCDFNDADAQQGEFNLIPKGTQALVRMAIKPGGYDDASKGWTGGYATASDETGAVFLSCEFVLLTGPFAKRKIWSNVGLHSNKGPTWAQMGRSFIKAVLNSSRNIHPDDVSPEAGRARQIRSFGDLDGAEFAARIGIDQSQGLLLGVARQRSVHTDLTGGFTQRLETLPHGCQFSFGRINHAKLQIRMGRQPAFALERANPNGIQPVKTILATP